MTWLSLMRSRTNSVAQRASTDCADCGDSGDCFVFVFMFMAEGSAFKTQSGLHQRESQRQSARTIPQKRETQLAPPHRPACRSVPEGRLPGADAVAACL